MIYFGVDPGMSGSVAALFDCPGGTVFLGHCSNEEPLHGLANWVECIRDTREGERPFAVIEKVGSMPKQGVSSSFKFGRSYGQLEGVFAALRIPYEFYTPQVWQKHLGCMTKGDKNVSKRKACQLFPDQKWTHRTADAILLAEFARRIHCRSNGAIMQGAKASTLAPLTTSNCKGVQDV